MIVEPVKKLGVNDYDSRVRFVKSPHLIGTGIFRVEPAHFVEQYGLLVSWVFGESVMMAAIGTGAVESAPDALEQALHDRKTDSWITEAARVPHPAL